MLIAPIVDDVLHDVGVAAIRHPLEEAAALDGNAPFAASELVLRYAGNDLCAIEQYTLAAARFGAEVRAFFVHEEPKRALHSRQLKEQIVFWIDRRRATSGS